MTGRKDRGNDDIAGLYASGKSFVDAAEAAFARERALRQGPPGVPVIMLAALGAGILLRCALAIEGKPQVAGQDHFRLFTQLSVKLKADVVSRYIARHRATGGGAAATRNLVLKRIRRHGRDVQDWRDVAAIERRRGRPLHHLVFATALRDLIADEFGLLLPTR